MKILTYITLLFSIYTGYTNSQWNPIQTNQFNSFSDIQFLNLNTGYIYNDVGRILKTTNGGLNWFLAGTNGVYSPNGMTFIDVNTGWVVGHDGSSVGRISKTTNGGINWLSHQVSGTIYLTDVNFINNQTGWISESLGKILKTTNSGNNWFNQTSGTDWYLYSIKFLDSLNGWVVGEYGTVRKTTNGGINWTAQSIGTTYDLREIFFLNSEVGWICGENGFLKKSTNSGQNWFSQNIGSSNSIGNIEFVSLDTGWISASFGYNSCNIMKTTNGGINWINQLSLGFENTIRDFDFIHQSGWAVGDTFISPYQHATLYKTTNGGTTIGITSINNSLPGYYFLYPNYPNPFNPQTKIKFDIPANEKGQMSNVKLIIYDLLGREVTTLVNEELKPGTYEADWDGSNFSSGVYFYKIISNDFVETKKMVLMK